MPKPGPHMRTHVGDMSRHSPRALEVQCLCGGLLLKLGALDAKATSQVRVIGSDGQAVVQSCLQSLYGHLQSDEVSEAFNSAIAVQCTNKF